MTLYADRSISQRRPDQSPEVLYFDRSDIAVDAETPFVASAGRRFHGGLALRLGVILTPGDGDVSAALTLRFGSLEGRLAVSEDGTWTVDSEDSDGPIPVAQSPLLAGTSYAVELVADFGSGEWRHVIPSTGVKVSPSVVDLVPGAEPVEERYTVDVMQGGVPDPNMPSWVARKIASYSAEALLEEARQNGGRLTVSHVPEQSYEEQPRPAPLVTVEDGPPHFTFSVESAGSLAVERIWAVEA